MDRLERALVRATRGVALGAVACLLGLATLTVADVLLRWLAGAPLRGFNDFAAVASAIVCAACFPALIARRGNVTIRFAGSLLGTRANRWLDAFGALVTALFFLAMTVQYARYSLELTGAGERMAILRWPTGPFWWAVTLMIAVTALAAAAVFLLDLARARRGKPG
jgi:TRAP-type C4-dicarboxylate transport system permease small subunit